ncbi:hypothetical protein [Streptomyces sp. NBC_01429]|uniref:hypothetical protein n=1 Tax=Streptomyces sp. NBC_01429 TaxID=2903862 RepID=UPI002E293CDC|nr:hypothetical protein [Streptomyces sp. NBC_01429]
MPQLVFPAASPFTASPSATEPSAAVQNRAGRSRSRAHLTSPQVDLPAHVTDAANTFLYADLSDIVPLGYSYGGMVVTEALGHVADHVTLLVYLDAFLPRDGDSLNDLAGAGYCGARPAPARSGSPRLRARRHSMLDGGRCR